MFKFDHILLAMACLDKWQKCVRFWSQKYYIDFMCSRKQTAHIGNESASKL